MSAQSCSRRTRGGLAFVLGLLLCLLMAARAEGQSAPQVLEPRSGDVLPIPPAPQPKPPFVLIFTPVEGAVSYIAELSGGGAFQVAITDFNQGEVVVAALVLPPAAAEGAYVLRIEGRDAADQPVGDPSDPVAFSLIETAPAPFAPGADVQASGFILASSVTLAAGVTVSASEDLTILSLGPVVIDGEIVGEDGVLPGEDGVSLHVTSASGISISGSILAGAGADGASATDVAPPGQPASAVGGAAGNGGGVTLLANGSDLDILASARIATGVGGTGGSATAEGGDAAGEGEKGGLATAEGGNGGHGGDLAVVSFGGDLTVAEVPGLLTAAGGGPGGGVVATGGDGGPGSASELPGPGGAYETTGGQGGNSGNLSLSTLDWDGDGTVTPDEFAVVAGGEGASAGASNGTAGQAGEDSQAVTAALATLKNGACGRGEGQTPDTVKDTPKKAGDGWSNPGFGDPAGAVGLPGIGSGKGGGAFAKGGDGGNLKTIGLNIGAFGLQWGLAFVSAGDGGSAVASGGPGGPNGGDGGDAIAEGGKGGGAEPAPGPDQFGGNGGEARAFGGNGTKPPPCCTPPGPGLIGGKGGLAEATGGDGGAANNTGGNGGGAGARGGAAGNGGDGCPPGAGGAGGVANVTPGAAGIGTLRNGVAGGVLFQANGANGAPGADCCDKTKPACNGVGSSGSLQVTVQDTSSGLKSIQVTAEDNTNFNVGQFITGFTEGQTTPFVFTATRAPDPTKKASITFEVKDVAGNATSCDPVVMLVVHKRGKPVNETVTGVPRVENLITVYNGTPGLQGVFIDVNGRKFKLKKLRDGERRTVDIDSAMRRGSRNVIKLTANGDPGDSATVVIHE